MLYPFDVLRPFGLLGIERSELVGMRGQEFGAAQAKFACYALDVGARQLIPHVGNSFQSIGNGSGLGRCRIDDGSGLGRCFDRRDLDSRFDSRRFESSRFESRRFDRRRFDRRRFDRRRFRLHRLRLIHRDGGRITAARRRTGRGGHPRRDLRQQAVAPFFRLGDLPFQQFDKPVILCGARSGQPALRVRNLAAEIFQFRPVGQRHREASA